MPTVKRAHRFEIRLCSDASCRQVHFVLCDESHEPFAEFLFEPDAACAFDFVGVLVDACRDAQRESETTH